MDVFLKWWRKRGLHVFIHLDDILLVSKSKSLQKKHTAISLQDLGDSGMTMNFKKSNTTPRQWVHHMRFRVHLGKGPLQVPAKKLKTVRKQLGKFLTQTDTTCRKAAAILGSEKFSRCLALSQGFYRSVGSIWGIVSPATNDRMITCI